MITFEILKKSKKSGARIGVLKTPHGEVETPTLVPVATQAAVKTLTSDEVCATKTQILIANTFHLHLKPGEAVVKKAGGLHEFMQWKRPLMTDSGGFQVFSLGFGRDLGVGKVLKYFPENENERIVSLHTKPKDVRITERGVYFKSPVDGAQIFIGPRESIKIQEALGADIMFAFDECTPPLANHAYAKKALALTHRWAEICLETRKSNQALYGIVQGSHYKNLREEAARYVNSLSFDGFGIGGDLGNSKKTMLQILRWTLPHLNKKKPRHLLGIGHLDDIEPIIKAGIDTFDCTVPTMYARKGVAFTSHGKLIIGKSVFLNDKKPLDKCCACDVCGKYSRSYISHLFRAKEITALRLLTEHNLFYFNSYVENLRWKIKQGDL